MTIVTNSAEVVVSTPEWNPDEIVFTLGLTRAQLRVTHTALHSLLDDFGHDERDVAAVVRQVLDKLPGTSDMPTVDFTTELHRRSSAA